MKTKNFFSKSIIALAILLLFGANTFATKHVLYMDNVVNTNQPFCVSLPLPSDSFEVHTPNVFVGGGTWWKVNGVGYAYNCDSMLFIPGTMDVFTITAVSYAYGFEMACVLTLYSGPPSHADFSMTGTGSINAAKDTIWMCGTSISVTANASGSESFTWYGPSGFVNYSDNPIDITIPGLYTFVRPNPCDTTIDSIIVIQPVNSLPNLGQADTTLCNPALGDTVVIDAGSGFDSYVWSTSETAQSIIIDTSGTYTVTVSNTCISGSVSKTIHYENYPSINLGSDTVLCLGGAVQLKPHPTYVFTSYSWSDGSHMSLLNVTETGVFNVTVTQGACTEVSNTVNVTFRHPYADEAICIATVDAPTGQNKIVFAPTQNVGTASFNIYKLSGTYTLLGNMPIENSPVMVFYDTVSNPMASAVRYKISTVDTCGNESALSFGHGTIKINSNPATGGGVDLTVVDSYWEESGTFSPTKLYILIDSLDNGSLHVMDSIDAVFNSYTITNPYVGATYVMGVAFPWNGCNGAKSLNLNNMSFSNKSSIITGIFTSPKKPNIAFAAYPNPSSGVFAIKGLCDNDRAKITVTDLSGRTILITEQTNFDLSSYDAGVYSVSIITVSGSTNLNLVLVK